VLVCGQEHDAKKEEKPQAAADTRLGTVAEDQETPKDVTASSSGSPMLGKPGAAKPKGSKCHYILYIEIVSGCSKWSLIILKHAIFRIFLSFAD